MGEEVQFPDGSTAVIKRYMRSRVVGYQDSAEPRGYEEDEASVPVMGHVVEMAKPCKYEYVTLITYSKPTGFWQAMNPATTVSRDKDAADAMTFALATRAKARVKELSPDQRHEEQFEAPDRRRARWVNAFWFLGGLLAGALGMGAWLG